MNFLTGKKKLLMGLVGFFAPEIVQYTTGQVGWREAVQMSVLAAVGYCVAEGVADAGRARANADQAVAETIAARPGRRRPAAKEPV